MENYRLVQHGVSLGIGGPRAPGPRLPAPPQAARAQSEAGLAERSLLLVRGAGRAPARPLAAALHLGGRGARGRARAPGAGFLEVPLRARKHLELHEPTRSSEMTEWEFISEVAERADIGLMFDVNNVYVSAYNHGFDPYEFIRSVPARAHRADPPGGPHEPRQVHHRHPPRPGDRRRSGTCTGDDLQHHGAGLDADRMGRRDPRMAGARRRGGEGPRRARTRSLGPRRGHRARPGRRCTPTIAAPARGAAPRATAARASSRRARTASLGSDAEWTLQAAAARRRLRRGGR